MSIGTFSQQRLFRSGEKDWNQFTISTAVIDSPPIFIVTQSHGPKNIINILKGQFDQIFRLLFWGSTIYQDQERNMALKYFRSSNDFTLAANVVNWHFFKWSSYFLLKCFWTVWKSYWSAASVLGIQCGVLSVTVSSILNWFFQLIQGCSWIFT